MAMKKYGKGVLKRCPKGWYLVDVARSLTQARDIIKAYPKEYKPKIVATPQYAPAFPYHIAVKRGRA
jgi:hypothetical protein